MTHLTIRRRWAFFGIALAIGAGVAGVRWRHAAGNGAPVEDAALLAVAVTESTVLAEARGAGSDAVVDENPLAAPRGLGTMTGRAAGTTEIVTGVRLASHKVNVVIHNGFARTEVEETFENTTGRVLEGRYLFPVPPDASVSRLALYVGADLVEGEIVERERAARIFKGIVEDTVRPRDPALLEWVKGSEVSLKVFPLPAHGTRKVVLAYDQVLPEASGQVRYLYPLSLGQDRAVSIDDFTIDVTAADATTSLIAVRTPGYAATTAPSGPLHVGYSARAFTPTSDFVLEYERAPSAGPGASAYPAPLGAATPIGKVAPAEDGYLTMRLPVRIPAGPRSSTHHDRAIVLDVSQSQSKETLAGEIAIARGVLRRLEPEERFTLLACDSACSTYPDDGLAAASPTAIEDAGRWLSARAIGGSSDIAGALLAATTRLGPDRAGQIVYLGDGTPSAGELSAETIAARVRPEILARKIDVRLFGAGRTIDEVVLGGLAHTLGAAYERVSTGEPLARRIDAIALGLDNPLLVDPALEVPEGIYDIHPRVLPNLHAGQELLITARARAGERGEIKLKGTLGGAAYTDAKAIVWAPAAATVPPRLWASAKIADLEVSTDEAAKKEVIALSRAHKVMSRAASFLVLENDRMFAEFGIERTARKPAVTAKPSAAGGPKAPDSESWGMIGLLNGQGAAPGSALSFGDDTATTLPGEAFGAGGLGLTGIGEGGGGTGSGIGLGTIGTIGSGQGFGSGHGRLGGDHRSNQPTVRMGAVSVSGSMPPEVIQRIVRQNFGRFRLCYETGLRRNPNLQGRVSVRFIIGSEGSVSSLANGGSDLPDADVVACVVRSFSGLTFPPAESGVIAVTYPILFTPEGGASAQSASRFAPPTPSAVHRDGDERWTTQGEDALAKLRGAVHEGEMSRQRHDALIRGLLARGRFAEALSAARRFAELDPDLPGARELLAQTAAAAGEGELARTSLDAELEVAPSNADLHTRAARAFEAAGDERRACAHFRSLAELRKTDDSARYEALRCRARLGERDAVLAEAGAIDKPGKRVTQLAAALAAGPAPAYDPAVGSGGDLEAKLTCSGESERCPTVVVITPSGKVISPWTPAARGGAVAMTNLSSGTYRTLVVGGEPGTACEVTVRAFNTTKKLSVTRGGTQTILATSVTIPEAGFGFGWGH